MRLLTSRPALRASSSRVVRKNGVPELASSRYSSISFAASAALHRSMITVMPPWSSGETDPSRPAMWPEGNAARTRPVTGDRRRVAASRLLCVCWTPFGSLVVPEV